MGASWTIKIAAENCTAYGYGTCIYRRPTAACRRASTSRMIVPRSPPPPASSYERLPDGGVRVHGRGGERLELNAGLAGARLRGASGRMYAGRGWRALSPEAGPRRAVPRRIERADARDGAALRSVRGPSRARGACCERRAPVARGRRAPRVCIAGARNAWGPTSTSASVSDRCASSSTGMREDNTTHAGLCRFRVFTPTSIACRTISVYCYNHYYYARCRLLRNSPCCRCGLSHGSPSGSSQD